jgi:hypothetical protein
LHFSCPTACTSSNPDTKLTRGKTQFRVSRELSKSVADKSHVPMRKLVCVASCNNRYSENRFVRSA